MRMQQYVGCRFAYGMYRRSRALRDVPGPEYPVLKGMLELLSMRDMHRVCTEYAERYGPIFKWRLFTFHVSCCLPSCKPWLLCTLEGCVEDLPFSMRPPYLAVAHLATHMLMTACR